ncbi:hypothetical protein GCM10027093_03130 [Paraburkholderia jirisanensis]
MTDISEEAQSHDRAAAQNEARTTSMWGRFLLLVVAGTVIAGFAFLGYSSLYCRDFAGAVIWTILIGVGGVGIAAVETPELFWSALLAYIAVAFIVCRYTAFRLAWLRFAIGIVAGYMVAAVITWIFVSPHSCNFA